MPVIMYKIKNKVYVEKGNWNTIKRLRSPVCKYQGILFFDKDREFFIKLIDQLTESRILRNLILGPSSLSVFNATLN